jgi:predicted nucleotide-binding protein
MPPGTDLITPEQGISRVIEVLIKSGDYVSVGQSVVVIENDSFIMNIPADKDGIVLEVLVTIGQAISEGTAILSYRVASAVASNGDIPFDISSTVFLVHGRNDGLKETVARCIEKLGLNVSILHEKSNEGRTIIEKFEDNTSVAFAVVLMTADDRGGLHDAEYGEQLHRARQNVIFELGYFIGKIGRKRVCALYEPLVEMPSDYHGVTYVEIDDKGAWRFQLARELKQAGLAIDLNRLI